MKKGWTTTKLVTIGALAVLGFLFQIIFVKGIFLSTGSIFGAISALVIYPFFLVFVALIIQRFGAVAFWAMIYFLIALPTPSIIPKVVGLFIDPLVGLFIDTLSQKLKEKRKLFSFIGGMVYDFILSLELIVLYFTIGLPGTKNIPRFLVSPSGLIIATLIISIVGGFSGYLGFLVYKKLATTSVVKRIQK